MSDFKTLWKKSNESFVLIFKHCEKIAKKSGFSAFKTKSFMENQFCRVLKTSEMWFLCMSFLNPSMFVFKGEKNCCTVRTSENCDQKILHHLLKWSNQWPEGKFSPLCSTCTRSGNFVNSGKNFTKSPRKWKSRENENDMPNFTHRLSYKIPLRMRPLSSIFSRFMNRFGQIGLFGGLKNHP